MPDTNDPRMPEPEIPKVDVGDGAQSSPEIASTPIVPTIIECPGCGAKVHSANAEPGAKIRCLNCGMRFSPAGSGSPAAVGTFVAEHAPEKDQSKPFVREPKSAGYWLLRIPAIIYAVGINFALIFAIITFASEVAWRGLRHLYDILWLLYIPLMPLSAFFAFMLTRSFSKLEAATLKAAWRNKLVQNPLPMAPGSSLPYLLPLAAGPAVVFIALLVAKDPDDYNYGIQTATVPAGFISFGTFILAFMFDDLRQFIWRQKALADACAQNAGGEPPGSLFVGMSSLALCPSLMVVGLAFMFGTLALAEYEREISYGSFVDPQVYFIWVLFLLALMSIAITFFLMGFTISRSRLAWWRAAASLPGERNKVTRLSTDFDALSIIVRMLLGGFAVVGSLTLFSAVSRNSYSNTKEIIAVAFAIVAGGFACFTLSELYAEIRSWRKAQNYFWLKRDVSQKAPGMSSLLKIAFTCVLLLSCIEGLTFMATMYEDIGRFSNHWEDYMAIPLFGFLLHFPAIWAVLAAREFFLVEAFATELARQPAEIQMPA